MAQTVKSLPAIWETMFDAWIQKIPWRREWHPTPVFLPGASHGQRAAVHGVTKSWTRLRDYHAHSDRLETSKVMTGTPGTTGSHGYMCKVVNFMLCMFSPELKKNHDALFKYLC